jgi:NosR/NirI family nitrous oxide reductase transcriptional regulator
MRHSKSIMGIAAAFLAIATAVPFQQVEAKSSKSSTQIIYTGDIAKKVYGYGGKTPVNIYVKNGKIQKIEALQNNESPQYFQKATSKVFSQYEGKTVKQAINLKADAATGATYSSQALIKNIQMGLAQAGTKSTTTKKTKKRR